jgi:hypothetical protein
MKRHILEVKSAVQNMEKTYKCSTKE